MASFHAPEGRISLIILSYGLIPCIRAAIAVNVESMKGNSDGEIRRILAVLISSVFKEGIALPIKGTVRPPFDRSSYICIEMPNAVCKQQGRDQYFSRKKV